jgi:integrase
MSRPSKGPRLYLRRLKRPRRDVWVIRDGTTRESTKCDKDDRRGAEEALARYIANKYTPPQGSSLSEIFVEEVLAGYLKEHAAESSSRAFLFDTARPILEWWSGKKLSDVNARNCRAFVRWRTTQTDRRARKGRKKRFVTDQTARHNLKTLRAAIYWYHREYGPLSSVPKLTLPSPSPKKIDYWLSRQQVGARIRAAMKSKRTRHVARALLIGVYTGTRPGAIFALKWLPSPIDGWFDLDSETLHRKGIRAQHSRKRHPPARIHAKLLPHLRRWRKADMALGITSVVHYQGEEIAKLRRSWDTVAKLAKSKRKDGPHIMRHTAATWQMQAGTNIYEAAGYLGMSPETLWAVYGHHHPDFQSAAARATGKRGKKLGASTETG